MAKWTEGISMSRNTKEAFAHIYTERIIAGDISFSRVLKKYKALVREELTVRGREDLIDE